MPRFGMPENRSGPYGDAEAAIQTGAAALRENRAIWENIENLDERLRFITAIVINAYQNMLLREFD